MNNIYDEEFASFLYKNGITHCKSRCQLTRPHGEYIFRIPIGDYRLQLDYRIMNAFSLLSLADGLFICRRSLIWNIAPNSQRPLDAWRASLSIDPASSAIHLPKAEYLIGYVFVYLTNRWGSSQDSLYVIPSDNSDVMLYAPGASESLFVVCNNLAVHDHCVKMLASLQIPAYGRHVGHPICEPRYNNITIGTSIIEVDPFTGKPIGPGSDESVLDKEYLP